MILRENIPAEDRFEKYWASQTSSDSKYSCEISTESRMNIEVRGLTPFALAMPDEYKSDDAVESYRRYYMSPEKQRIASWNKKRERPEWYR